MNSLTGISSPVGKLLESKMWQAHVKAKKSNYETTANAVTRTIPVVTALLVITVLSEMLLTFGLDNKLSYPAAKQSFTCQKFSSKLSPYSSPEVAPSGAYFDYIGMKNSEAPCKNPHSKLCPFLKQKECLFFFPHHLFLLCFIQHKRLFPYPLCK